MRTCPISFDDYLGYLRSEHWQELRARIRGLAGERCQECGVSPGPGVILDVHHQTYERLGHERDSDMQLLCRDCHLDVHIDWDPFAF